MYPVHPVKSDQAEQVSFPNKTTGKSVKGVESTTYEKEQNRMHHVKPMVLKQDETQRKGRGFSPNELEKAGVNKLQARELGLPVDYRRKSAHDENVKTIKSHASKAKDQAKT